MSFLHATGRFVGASAAVTVEAAKTAAAYTGGLGDFGAGVKSGYHDRRAAFAQARIASTQADVARVIAPTVEKPARAAKAAAVATA
jgi:hypothetical protein